MELLCSSITTSTSRHQRCFEFSRESLYGAMTKKGVNNTFFFVFVKLPEDVPIRTRVIEEMDEDFMELMKTEHVKLEHQRSKDK